MTERALQDLLDALRRLPGVGARSAQRMAFHLLQHDREGARRIAAALQAADSQVRHCERCHTFTEGAVCPICLDPRRDARLLAVVETPADQAALERSGSYNGLYFVLMGRISPLDGVGAREVGAAELTSILPAKVAVSVPTFTVIGTLRRESFCSSAVGRGT